MSDFGFWELALTMLIALLIVGPERLPQLVSTIGRWVGRIKKLTLQLKTEFAEEANAKDVKKILADAKDTADQASSDIKREFVNTDPLVKAIEDQIDKGRFAADAEGEKPSQTEQNSKAGKPKTIESKQQHNHDG